jgi:hypothetical protein
MSLDDRHGPTSTKVGVIQFPHVYVILPFATPLPHVNKSHFWLIEMEDMTHIYYLYKRLFKKM